jgi:hypothetical protein
VATYYVDFVNGLDANNGLGPDATTGNTNKPWKTLTKLLGAAGMASGDTAYLAPGVFRESVTVAMTSATVETKILGDPQNTKGFKTSGGVLVTPGEVRLTTFLTDDKTPGAAGIPLSTSSRDFLTFENMTIETSGNNVAITCPTLDATNITFRKCKIIGGAVSTVTITPATAIALTWLFDQCIFWCTGVATAIVNCTFPTRTSPASDYDVGITVQNCILYAGSSAGGVRLNSSGALAQKPGGVKVLNTLIWGGSPGVSTASANCSTTFPVLVYDCDLIGQSTSLSANTTGQIVEDYNILVGGTAPRSAGITAGTHSQSGTSPPWSLGLELGEALWQGRAPRTPFTPTAGSPLLGFGTDASVALTVDLNDTPRPSGGASASKAVGPLERRNTWGRETATVRTGSNALSITGPGTQDFDVPVDATSTTVTVYMRYDSTYAGTKPQIQVRNGAEAGVADATSSAVTTVNTWEQLSLTFTPTSKGIVTVRMLSSDTNGGGKAFADDFAVA